MCKPARDPYGLVYGRLRASLQRYLLGGQAMPFRMTLARYAEHTSAVADYLSVVLLRWNLSIEDIGQYTHFVLTI